MKKLLFTTLLLCLSVTGFSAAAETDFTLVQSVPQGTILAMPNVPYTQTVWTRMIQQAKHTVDIGAFYMNGSEDSALGPILKALKQAAKRGVKVRILLSKIFYKTSLPTIKPLLNTQNITIHIVPYETLTGGVMHAKYMIVDGINSYVGSANFDWTALTQIHEIGVRIHNRRFAQTLLTIFNLDWQLAKTKNFTDHPKLLFKKMDFKPVTTLRPILIKNNKDILIVSLAASPKILLPTGYDWGQTQFINLLKNARHSVVMQVLKYSPEKSYGHIGYWPALDNAIRAAAARGVKIKLIVSNWDTGKPNINFLKSLSFVPNVEVKISSIPQLKDHFVPYARVEHCKYMVVDNDLTWIGTGNWQWSYFNNTRNISVIINGQKPAEQLRKMFFKDWNGPYTKFVDSTKKYKLPKIH